MGQKKEELAPRIRGTTLGSRTQEINDCSNYEEMMPAGSECAGGEAYEGDFRQPVK